MKKTWKSLCGALALLASMAAAAESVGIRGGFIGIGLGSASPYTWHNAQLTSFEWAVDGLGDQLDFNGSDFGAFAQGSSAFLSSGQLITYKGDSEQVTAANLHYCVYSGASCASGFSTFGLGSMAEVSASDPFTDAAGHVYQVTSADLGDRAALGDRRWDGLPGIDFVSSLLAGSYTLDVYFSAVTDGVTGSLDSGTEASPFRATFSVSPTTGGNVPEPSTLAMAALTLGLLAGTRRHSR